VKAKGEVRQKTESQRWRTITQQSDQGSSNPSRHPLQCRCRCT